MSKIFSTSDYSIGDKVKIVNYNLRAEVIFITKDNVLFGLYDTMTYGWDLKYNLANKSHLVDGLILHCAVINRHKSAFWIGKIYSNDHLNVEILSK